MVRRLADSNVDWTLLGLNIATSVLGLLHVLYLVTLLVLDDRDPEVLTKIIKCESC